MCVCVLVYRQTVSVLRSVSSSTQPIPLHTRFATCSPTHKHQHPHLHTRTPTGQKSSFNKATHTDIHIHARCVTLARIFQRSATFWLLRSALREAHSWEFRTWLRTWTQSCRNRAPSCHCGVGALRPGQPPTLTHWQLLHCKELRIVL